MLLDTTNNICELDVTILNLLSIFKSIIEFATIITVVVLIVLIIVDIIKAVSSQDVDNKKLFKSISKRAIAAVLVFLVPFIINLAISIIPNGNFKYVDCYKMAEKETVIEIAVENAKKSMQNLNQIINNNGSYDDAFLAYEQARKDIKLIPNSSSEKEDLEKKLKEAKVKVNNLK